jgi:transketolase
MSPMRRKCHKCCTSPFCVDRVQTTAHASACAALFALARTHIGYGAPDKQDSFESHGSPLGVDEVRLAKQNLGWPTEPLFFIPEKAVEHFRKAIQRGKAAEMEWNDRFTAYSRAFPDLAKAFLQAMLGELPDGWDRDIPAFPADAKGVATRVAAGNDLVGASSAGVPTVA